MNIFIFTRFFFSNRIKNVYKTFKVLLIIKQLCIIEKYMYILLLVKNENLEIGKLRVYVIYVLVYMKSWRGRDRKDEKSIYGYKCN